MDLSKYWDDGKYLGEGWHTVVVNQVDTGESPNTGSSYVEYKLLANGKETKVRFFLTEKAEWRLGSFAKACGKSREQLSRFSFKDLINCKVQVLIQKKGKYHEIEDWAAEGADTYTPTPAQEAPQQESDGSPSGDGIPF